MTGRCGFRLIRDEAITTRYVMHPVDFARRLVMDDRVGRPRSNQTEWPVFADLRNRLIVVIRVLGSPRDDSILPTLLIQEDRNMTRHLMFQR